MPLERWEAEGGRVGNFKASSPPGTPHVITPATGGNQCRPYAHFRAGSTRPSGWRKYLTALLNQHLADTFDFYGQKQAHRNVKGPQCYQLHELFDDLVEQLSA
jgi:hypothetical protein